jgi:hypothetical protein
MDIKFGCSLQETNMDLGWLGTESQKQKHKKKLSEQTHEEAFHNSYSFQNIHMVTKSRRIMGCTYSMDRLKMYTEF